MGMRYRSKAITAHTLSISPGTGKNPTLRPGSYTHRHIIDYPNICGFARKAGFSPLR